MSPWRMLLESIIFRFRVEVLNFRGVKPHKEPLYEWGAMSTMGIYYLIP